MHNGIYSLELTCNPSININLSHFLLKHTLWSFAMNECTHQVVVNAVEKPGCLSPTPLSDVHGTKSAKTHKVATLRPSAQRY